MKKLNKKGFLLAETLIVSTFIATTMVFIFVQFWLLKPELAIPDIPENKRVRDYLKSQPLTGHGDAFGKSIRIVQCYRCKVDNYIQNMIGSVMDIDQEIQNVNIQKVVIWIWNFKNELKLYYFYYY